MKMLNIRKMKAVLAVLTLLSASCAPADLYVADNDPNASDAVCEGRGTEALPYKTIQAAVDAAASGDTIRVKPGVYAEGVAKSPTGNTAQDNRVVLTKNIHLVSTGGAGVTEIRGRHGTELTCGLGSDSVRAVLVTEAAAGSVVEGFTLGSGATAAADDSANPPYCGGGFLALAEAYLVDSVVTNCVGTMGGGIFGGTAVRCFFRGCGGRWWDSGAAHTANLWNCVVDNDYFWSTSSAGQKCFTQVTNVNCTVVHRNGMYADFKDCKSYNLLSVAFAANEVVSGESYSCIYRKDGHGLRHCLNPLFGDYRLLDTSSAVQAGDAQYLESVINLPAEIARTDFYGNDLTGLTGAIAAGASQTVLAPPYGGLSFSERTPTVNGVTIPRGGYVYATEWPVRWELEVPGKDVLYYSIGNINDMAQPNLLPTKEGRCYFVPSPHPGELASLWPCVAAEVLWTDPEFGSDVSGDGTEGHPYRTLQHAMDVSKSVAATGYTLVKAKRGRYAEGGRNDENGVFQRLAMSNSASWPMKILAVDGPDETFLVGSTDGETDTRCLYASSATSFLQGFTLTDGRLMDTEGSVVVRGTLVDCVVSNCASAKNLCSTQTLAYRTRFLDNTLGSSLYAGSGAWAFCAFSGNSVLSGDLISGAGNPPLYNCTFVGNAVASTASILGSANVEPNNTVVDANGCRFTPCWASGMGTNMLWNFTRVDNTPSNWIEADPRIGEDFRPSALSPALGAGNLSLSAYYMRYANYYMQGDLYGRPVAMLADGRTHLGAVQEGFLAEYELEVTDGGVTVAGGAPGRHLVDPEQPVTLTVTSAAGGPRQALGVIVTDLEGTVSTNLFADLPGETWTATVAGPETSVRVSVLYSSDWYVDIENGDDAYDGFTAATAKKTLVGATTNAAVRAGDVIHVAPGTYETGTAKSKEDSLVFCRVVVPEGVTLASTGGRAVTTIRGAKAPTSEGGDGCGEGAVRCAYLNRNAKLVGFTLTGGRACLTWTEVRPEDSAGGGVCAANTSAEIVDCLFTDCKAEVAVGNKGTFIRCRMDNCGVSGKSFVLSGVVLRNCLVNKSGDSFGLRGCTVYNSTVLPTPGWHCMYSDPTTAYDSVLLGYVDGTTKCTGCVIATGDGYSSWGGAVTPESANVTDCVFTNVAALGLSTTDWKPTSAESLVVDTARAEATASAEGALDLAGVPRVLNGALDIGAYEWDWRPVYAQDFGRRCLAITGVTPNVVERNGYVVLDGNLARIALDVKGGSSKQDCQLPVTVTGAGVLTVELNGETIATFTAGENLLKFNFVGETAGLSFTFDGEGTAELGRIDCANGFVLIVR